MNFGKQKIKGKTTLIGFSDLFSGFGTDEDELGTGEEFNQFRSGQGPGSNPESSEIDLYGTLGLEERFTAVCWSSFERCGSVEVEIKNERMRSVVDITSPGPLVGESLLIFARILGVSGKYLTWMI